MIGFALGLVLGFFLFPCVTAMLYWWTDRSWD